MVQKATEIGGLAGPPISDAFWTNVGPVLDGKVADLGAHILTTHELAALR